MRSSSGRCAGSLISFSSWRVSASRALSRRMRLAIISTMTKENGKPPMIVPVWTVSTTAVPPIESRTRETVAMLATRITRNQGPDFLGAETNSASAYVPESRLVT